MEKIKREDCLWEKLKSDGKPIYLYGTGNGADKILDVLSEKGIPVSGVFASSGFVRDRYFRGMKVRSLESIEEEVGDNFTVLLSFGTTLPDVIENVGKIAAKHTLYVPEVPLFGSGLFDYDYYEEHLTEILSVEELLSDEVSRNLYSDMIHFRLTGEMKYLSEVETPFDSYQSLLSGQNIKTVIDCGAYRGDSAECIKNALYPDEIIAAEPDPKTFEKLKNYADGVSDCTVVPVNCAVGKTDGVIEISATAGRGSGVNSITRGAKSREVAVSAVDTLAGDKKIDFIKYDVEGDEADALVGSLGVIERDHPALSVSLYHRTEDIFTLPLFIRKYYPAAKFHLRRTPCLPAWDLILIVS